MRRPVDFRALQLIGLLCLGMAAAASCSTEEEPDRSYTTSASTGGTGASGGGMVSASATNASSSATGPGFCGDSMCGMDETCQLCGEDCSDADSPPTADTELDSEEQAFLGIINDYRMQNNLSPLTGCVSLHRAAQRHSNSMRDFDFFDHMGLDGTQAWDRACLSCFDKGCGPTTSMAENIAAGEMTATDTFEQWRTSPGHNANMLDPTFNYLGIGRAVGGGMYNVYWTNVFAADDEPSCY